MELKDILSKCDHTLLGQAATWADIQAICDDGMKYATASVCIPASFVKQAKEKGLVKHWGFSCHASPERMDDLLTRHPDAEFIQLQINYADWENPQVQSRKCLEIARKHGINNILRLPVAPGIAPRVDAGHIETIRLQGVKEFAENLGV